jgi:hypothetical protein
MRNFGKERKGESDKLIIKMKKEEWKRKARHDRVNRPVNTQLWQKYVKKRIVSKLCLDH